MAFALINKIRIHYETSGKGDPVLLINGLSAPAVNWTPQIKALAPHFTVVVMDNRGVGESDLPPEPVYTTGQMADDAAALLGELKLSRAHVVGASMGGTIAMELALRHPKLVRSLTLACTWSEGDARFLHTIESWISLAHRVPIEERLRHVLYPWLFSPAFFARKENVEQVFQRSMAYPHQTKPEAIERQGRGIQQWNGTRVAKLGSIKAPTLVMVGKDDILTPPQFSKALAKRIKGAKLAVLPRGGHGLFVEEADLVNRTLIRFLKGVRAK
jgi:3-oxoadipate enol-lactonase